MKRLPPILRISSFCARLLPCLLAAAPAAAADHYQREAGENTVSFVSEDGLKRAELRLLEAAAHLPTTRALALNLMDSLQGYELTADVSLRGFSFKYVDNGPCAGLVTYYDGVRSLFFTACGNVGEDELLSLYREGGEQLRLGGERRP